jgi:hypothetical protein
MRIRLMSLMLVVAGVPVFSGVLLAQTQAPTAGGETNRSVRRAASQANLPFDPKDFNGIWDRSSGGSRGVSRRPGDETTPPFTAKGKEMFDSYKPGYGPRAIPPALGNDPTSECNPAGMPRALLYPRPAQFIMTRDLFVQVFSWHRVFREIWTDGRKLPANFNPDVRRWYGYSAGRWEGNTLVVESAGFDDRAWLDQNGYPLSEQMRLEERYTRTDHDTIELKMTITDPVMYTRPWVAETKTFRLIPKEEVNAWYEQMTDLKGWYGLMEEICAPVDEIDNFNRRVRDPAGGVTH